MSSLVKFTNRTKIGQIQEILLPTIAFLDGETFKQMRIFHLHKLGETTAEMGKCNPPLPAQNRVSFGIYACSPLESSFTATFSEMRFESCKWLAHAV